MRELYKLKKRDRSKIRKGICFILCSLAVLLCRYSAEAADSLLPTASDNLNIGARFRNGEAVFEYMTTSRLVGLEDGYMRVFYTGKSVGVEYYDDNFNVKSKMSIAMELPVWGGFYAGSDAYYLIEGQNNPENVDSTEVIRVIKYDLAWNRKGAASIKSDSGDYFAKIGIPFDHGCVEAAESGGMLYIVTGHQGYIDPQYMQGHQGFLMIAVDEETMSGKIVDYDLWHSFAQYIVSKDSDLYVLEQSEGSRFTQLSRYAGESKTKYTIPVFKYGGSRTSAVAVSCYASVEGMALSSDHILCIGASIDQSKYDYYASEDSDDDIYGRIYNIYLTITPISNFSESATTVKWITNYTNRSSDFLGVKITKINDNRFLISWEEKSDDADSIDSSGSANVLHYVFIDGNGNKISREFVEPSMTISDCQPIVKGNQVSYYSSSANEVHFYSIDAESGTVKKKNYRVAGENAAWDFNKDTLTISGKGAISVELFPNQRFTTTSYGFIGYSPNNNVWTPIRNDVRIIVIEEGITSIPDNAFSSFSSLSEIRIPASVTSIGSNALPDGAHMIAPKGSFARKYAKENGIRCLEDITKAQVSGIKKEYKYTGQQIIPMPTVKFDGKKLKQYRDFYIFFENNKKKGTASVFIVGIGDYCGEIEKTFKIVDPDGKDASDRYTKSGLIYEVRKQKGKQDTLTVAGASKKSLTSVTIPDMVTVEGTAYKVTAIADKAFKNMTKLKSVTVGANITQIGAEAFSGAKKLNKIIIQGKALKKIGKNAFKGIAKNAEIRMDSSKVSAYKKLLTKSTGYTSKMKVTSKVSAVPKKGETATVGGLKYKVTKSSKSKGTVQVTGVKSNNLLSYTVPEKVKIGNYKFTVTGIAANAFKGCSKVKKITLPKSITSVGKKAFPAAASKLAISVPKAKYSKISKLLKKSGLGKGTAIKKR